MSNAADRGVLHGTEFASDRVSTQAVNEIPVGDRTLFAVSDGFLVLSERFLGTAGVRRLSAPGHTPGHSIYVIHDHGERVLVLGDAMYCPQQLSELEWGAVTDVDPALARKTRERYERDLELHGGGAVGCHFPELKVARALTR